MILGPNVIIKLKFLCIRKFLYNKKKLQKI